MCPSPYYYAPSTIALIRLAHEIWQIPDIMQLIHEYHSSSAYDDKPFVRYQHVAFWSHPPHLVVSAKFCTSSPPSNPPSSTQRAISAVPFGTTGSVENAVINVENPGVPGVPGTALVRVEAVFPPEWRRPLQDFSLAWGDLRVYYSHDCASFYHALSNGRNASTTFTMRTGTTCLSARTRDRTEESVYGRVTRSIPLNQGQRSSTLCPSIVLESYMPCKPTRDGLAITEGSPLALHELCVPLGWYGEQLERPRPILTLGREGTPIIYHLSLDGATCETIEDFG